MSFDLRSVGGVPVIGAGATDDQAEACGGWNFGWVPPAARTVEQQTLAAVAEQQQLAFTPPPAPLDATKALLWECWKEAAVTAAVGGVYQGVHQITGSCVGAGGGNAIFTLSAVEVVRLGDPEKALIPFWPLPYGRSRVYAGLRGRGDGSFAGAFGKAVSTDGVIPASTAGLPTFSSADGYVWGQQVELELSDGAQIAPQWLEQSRVHLVKGVARMRGADDVKAALIGGYPVMFCGDWGGLMRPPVTGSPAVLLNRRATVWQHNQTCIGWMLHPQFGDLFYVLNQWGLETHGRDPAGGPPGGYWVARGDMDYQCRNGECLALSQFQGFPAPDVRPPWVF